MLRAPRNRLRLSHALAGMLVLALLLAGALEPLDHALLQLRFDLVQRPAGQNLVLVEMDARSLHELDTWPWPRGYHAQVIERLLDAGVRQIAMDIDFSARSTPADDSALSRAVARAGDRLILPVFVQGAKLLSNRPAYENRPSPASPATRLGLANVRPEADGRIWRYPVADDLPSGYRASLAVLLAGSGHYRTPDFLIDYGIRADTIPRLSYADVLAGRIDPHLLAGRDVIIGSTAAELGDHLSVPIYRAVPGVLIHSLAYESIVQDRMLQRTGPAVTALGVVLLLLLLAPLMATDDSTWPRALAVSVATSGAIVAGAVAVQSRFPISVDSAAWHVTVFSTFLIDVVRRLRIQAILLFRQRMAQTHGRALMRSVVEDSFDGIIITSESGHIELANRAALRILGRSSSLVGLTRDAVFPGLKDIPAPAHAADGEPTAAHEIQITRDDGTAVSLEVVVSFSELRVSKRRYERRKRARRLYIYTFRDVTERRQMVAAQGKALEAALAASRAKSEFLANMSHELRTPLNAIIGFSEAILEQVFGPLGNDRYRAYVNDIHDSGAHLLSVIQQVLDVSRIEAGTLVLNEEAVDLAVTARDCEKIIRGSLAKAPRELNVTLAPDLPLVRADRTQMKQILLNLLSNAVKFTHRNGVIDIRLYVDREGRPTIDVIDNGIGIPADKLARLGEPFFQANASADGTGLGLYLVRHLVAMHEGTLAFDSERGRGTRVRVTLPHWRAIGDSPDRERPTPGSDAPAPRQPPSLFRVIDGGIAETRYAGG